jgi:hypothetical protein
MRAAVLVRQRDGWPWEEIASGLRAIGIEPVFTTGPADAYEIVVTWNDYGSRARTAEAARAKGALHLCLENGPGLDPRTVLIQVGGHNGPQFLRPSGGGERAKTYLPRLEPWRVTSHHLSALICGQRGGGYSPLAMPREWPGETAIKLQEIGFRRISYRPHPERDARAVIPKGVPITYSGNDLEYDLREVDLCVVFTSMAAIEAIMRGVPTIYCGPRHIASEVIRSGLKPFSLHSLMVDREAFFRKLAWNIWSLDELASGQAFRAYV